jgi:hypothetical protein
MTLVSSGALPARVSSAHRCANQAAVIDRPSLAEAVDASRATL